MMELDIFHEEIKCYVSSIRYEYSTKRAEITLQKNSKPDMKGTIEFFKRIDAGVNAIEVYQENEPYMFYYLLKNKWHARDYPS